jgi:hypothetical protein
MAEGKKTSVRLDAFVGAIHQDPANPQPTQLVSGFVGRGAEEGSLRIYSDPSLGSWVEVPADDVVHSQPIDNSPLGGSHVWLKGDAQLKPGSAAAAASAAQGAAPAGGLGGDVGIFNPFQTIHPTIWTQLGPCNNHTLGFTCTIFCPPNTAATLCTHAPPCGPIHTREFICQTLTCTIPPHCPITLPQQCLPHTLPPQCHPVTLPPQCLPHTLPPQCLPPTLPPHCFPATGGVGCPGTATCPIGQGGGAQMLAAAPTHAMGCPNTSTCTPQTHMLGCPGTSTCPPTHMPGCPGTSTCPPTQMPGCHYTSVCPPPTWPETIIGVCIPTLTGGGCPPTGPGVC